MALRALALVKREFGQKMEVREFFEEPSALGVTRALLRMMGLSDLHLKEYQTVEREKIDWIAEASLPNTAEFYPSAREQFQVIERSNPITILVTGADTAVGEQLLLSLLRRKLSDTLASGSTTTSYRIAVLGTLYPLTARDLVSALGKHPDLSEFLYCDSLVSHIDMLPGSLADDGLGLSSVRFAQLAHSLEKIYHFGILVSLAQSYDSLKRVNVEATREPFAWQPWGPGLELLMGP